MIFPQTTYNLVFFNLVIFVSEDIFNIKNSPINLEEGFNKLNKLNNNFGESK